MNLDGLMEALSNLLCVLPFCLGLIGFAATAGFLIWLARRQSRSMSPPVHVEDEQRADGLRVWSPDDLTDLSTDWDAQWNRLGPRVNARGTIHSVSEPKGPALVAFVLKASGARKPEGELHAHTTAQTFAYHIDREGVHIRVEDRPFDQTQGRPFGHVQPDGTLLDAGGHPIGSAPRPGGRPAIFSVGGVSRLRDERERSYPVTLNGRIVGHLAHPRAQMINAIPLKERQFPPVVTVAGSPSGEEATWLLALAILQIAFYNVLETIWTN
ncbi:MAG: hypothetical protein ACP5GX_08390 [Anaerolineae bacterium]